MGINHNCVLIGPKTGRTTGVEVRPRHEHWPLWIWWNLLSLDAPTVVCLWALFFLRAMHVPFYSPEVAVLTATVWIIYASDRTLDGLRAPGKAEQSERHSFYSRYAYAVLGALLAVAFATLWFGLTRLNNQTRGAGLVVGGAVGFYFVVVHAAPDWVARWFPKELVAGAIFAAGAMIPAWAQAESRKGLIPIALVFAGLCALNCVAIECWEHHRGNRQWHERPYWMINLADTRIVQVAVALIVVAGFVYILGAHNAAMKEMFVASAVSLSLIAALDRRSDDLSPQVLRVLADAALLTPAFFLLKSVL